MLDSFCKRVCDYFINTNVIAQEKRELYFYGLHQGVIMLSSIVTTLLIGSMMGMLWQSAVYLLIYIPIRSNAGGYHAGTPLRCYCSSTVLVVLTLYVMKTFEWTSFYYWSCLIVSTLLIFLLAPIEDRNKPFSQAEKRCFALRVRVLLAIDFSLAVIFYISGYNMLCLCIILALITLVIMLILGEIKNRILEKNNTQKSAPNNE